jgi:hypothetical protein
LTEGARGQGDWWATIIALNAEHTAGARIRIEPKHATVWRYPFEAITRIARRPHIGALHIGQVAGALAADASHDLIQGANLSVLDALPGAEGLSGGGLRGGCGTQQKQDKYGCKIPHGHDF